MYYNPFAFFDVDSLELSNLGTTFVCHPLVDDISEELFELYGIVALISAPIVFTIDPTRNTPEKKNRRHDFLTIPTETEKSEWKESAPEWLKFYIKRDVCESTDEMAIFTNNKNAIECVKVINAYDWIVFGCGLEHKIDNVIQSLLEKVDTVKFVSELIVPDENETEEQLDVYFKKWEELGAVRLSYDDVIELARHHRY